MLLSSSWLLLMALKLYIFSGPSVCICLCLLSLLASIYFFFPISFCLGIYSLSTMVFCSVLQVLQHVRLPLLSPKFLVGTVGSDPLIKSDEECR